MNSSKRNILILDIGSHKCQEVRVIDPDYRYGVKSLYRLAKRYKFRIKTVINDIRETRRIANEIHKDIIFKYVLVEPVPHRELMDFVSKSQDILFVQGVSSCDPSGEVELFLSSDSLGNSIIPSKPGLSGKAVSTFNHNFRDLYEYVFRTFVESGVCEKIILRMNAEGVEGPIIEYLVGLDASRRPCMIAGSLGDIKKCFGSEEYDKAIHSLGSASIPFVYFTSNELTWNSAIGEIHRLLNNPN